MIQTNTFFILIAITFGLVSCSKKVEHNPSGGPPIPPAGDGIYVLVKGGTSANINGVTYDYEADSDYKSTLAFYSAANKILTPDRFSQMNGVPLGLRATDMGIYGSKLYITLAGSRNVTVVDAATTHLLARTALDVPNNMHPYQAGFSPIPYHVCFFDGEAYIALENGTIGVMDTATLKITRYINSSNTVLFDPAVGLAVANGKLYLAGYNNVYAIDPHTGSLIHSIATNYIVPFSMSADALGNVYVQYQYDTSYINFGNSDFRGITSGITVISSAADKVIYQTPVYESWLAPPIVVSGNTGYYMTGNYLGSVIRQFDAATFSLLQSPYFNDAGVSLGEVTALTADPATGQIIVGDSKVYDSSDGTVYVFSDHKFQYSFPAGTNPIKIVLLHP